MFVFSTRSPDRVAKWDRVDHYNGLVRAYCAATPRHTFIDLNPGLVDSEGRPRLELYQKDKLHVHPPAYVEFAAVIKPVLTRVWGEVESSAPKPSGNSFYGNKGLHAFLNGKLVPVFTHRTDDLASFQFSTTQFIVNGTATPRQIVKVLWCRSQKRPPVCQQFSI